MTVHLVSVKGFEWIWKTNNETEATGRDTFSRQKMTIEDMHGRWSRQEVEEERLLFTDSVSVSHCLQNSSSFPTLVSSPLPLFTVAETWIKRRLLFLTIEREKQKLWYSRRISIVDNCTTSLSLTTSGATQRQFRSLLSLSMTSLKGRRMLSPTSFPWRGSQKHKVFKKAENSRGNSKTFLNPSRREENQRCHQSMAVKRLGLNWARGRESGVNSMDAETVVVIS
jgi:hypothetical protein